MLIWNVANNRMVPYSTALWRNSVNYQLVIQPCVHFFPADKKCSRTKKPWDVEPRNPFCLHKLLGTEDFVFPAHLTLHEFCFLGRKDILWFGLQMAKWMIIPVGFINQAFGLVGNTFLGDWCQFFFPLYCAWCSADLSLEQVTCQLLEKRDLLVTDITKSPQKIKRLLVFCSFVIFLSSLRAFVSLCSRQRYGM